MLTRMLLLLYLLLITMLSLMPPGTLQIAEASLFPHADKVVHFSMYMILAFLIFFTWPRKFAGNRQFIPLLVVFAWGTVMEILQYLGGYGRHFSLLDIVANTLGFFPAWMVWKWVGGLRLWHSKDS